MALETYWERAAGTDLHCQNSTEEHSKCKAYICRQVLVFNDMFPQNVAE